MYNMNFKDFKIIGESQDTTGFYEIAITCPEELNPNYITLFDGDKLIMGYDKDDKMLHLVEFKEDDDSYENYQKPYVIEEYLDSRGRESVILDFRYISESDDEREIMKIIVKFIEETENDKETFDFIERALIDYLI